MHGHGKKIVPLKGPTQKAKVIEKKTFMDVDVRKRPRAKTPPHLKNPYAGDSMIPFEVQRVLAKINDALFERRKQEVAEKMALIHRRVILALKHYGMSGTIEITASEHAALNVSTLTRGYDASDRSAEMNHRQELLQLISQYLLHCTERKNIIQTIEDWFNTYDLSGVPTEDDLEATAAFLKENNLSFEEAYTHVLSTVDDINDIGYKLLKEAGFIDSDDEDGSGRSRGRGKKFAVPVFTSVLDASQLLSDPTSLNSALEDIRHTLDYAIRSVKTNKQKTIMRAAHKQHKFIMKAVDKRLEESSEKSDNIIQLEIEINTLKNARERLENEISKKDKEINKLDVTVLNLEEKLRNVQEQQEILEEEVRDLEEFKSNAENPISPPKVSIVSLKRESTRVRIVESTPELRALREELEETRASLQEEMARTGELEKSLLEEQLKKSILESKEKLREGMEDEQAREEAEYIEARKKEEMEKMKIRTIADDSADFERQIARLKTELACKNEQIDFQERSLLSMREELHMLSGDALSPTKDDGPKEKANQAKRMLVKMRKSHEEEVVRLKAHVDSERKRVEADLRRMDQIHKEQLANVHKQSSHLLRAINRFKGQVANILDREALPDAASDVRNLANLQIDDAHADTRKLLAQMAGNAVELLVAIEFKLSQSLMNKRLEIKDNTFARKFANKDLELQLNVTSKARETAETMHERLKETKEQLKHTETALSELRKTQEKRFESLNDRNERLMAQYKAVQRQMATMHNDCGESLKRKDRLLKSMTQKREGLSKKVEDQQAAINYMQTQLKQHFVETDYRYQLNLNDQYDNMMKLEKAFQNGLITKEMHSLTAGLIKQFMSLPELKLKVLFERYIAFRKLQDAKGQLEKQLSESLLSSRREELTKQVELVDEEITTSKQIWSSKQEELEEKRKILFNEMASVFGEMVKTSELLHIRPIHVERPQQTQAPGEADGKVAKLPSRRQAPSLPHLAPSKLVGKSVSIEGKDEPMWKVEFPALPPIPQNQTMLLASRLMFMDVNPRMRNAQRDLKKVRNRESLHPSVAEAYDYEDCVVRSLQELLGRDDHMPPQRPTTPTTPYNFINKPCQCGSLCGESSCKIVKINSGH